MSEEEILEIINFIQQHCTIESPAGEPVPFHLSDEQAKALHAIYGDASKPKCMGLMGAMRRRTREVLMDEETLEMIRRIMPEKMMVTKVVKDEVAFTDLIGEIEPKDFS